MNTIIVRNGTHLLLIFALTLEHLHVQVKPGLPYLDIIRLLRDNSPLPIAAYQVLLCPILAVGKIFLLKSWSNIQLIMINECVIKLDTHYRSLSIIHKNDPYILIPSWVTSFMVASTVIVFIMFCYYVSSNFTLILSQNGWLRICLCSDHISAVLCNCLGIWTVYAGYNILTA